MDVGDFVVVTNAKNIKLTGRKLDQKVYHRYSGYPGGLKTTSIKTMLERHPERVVQRAVSHMLARNRLRPKIMKRLKVVADDKHNFKIDHTITGN